MHRYTVLSVLLIQSLLYSTVQATIDLVYLIKEQAYEQYGNNLPNNLAVWSFGSGVLGDDQLTAASITFPGAPGPTPISGVPGDFQIESADFATQGELDTAYPDGSFSLSATDSEQNQDLGPYSLTGGSYPTIPHITNAVELQASDYSQPFQLTWSAFADYSAGGSKS